MKKAPESGSYVWVVCTKDADPGSSYVKRIKVCTIDKPSEPVDPSTALADFFGVYDARGNYYHFDIVFDTEAKATRLAAAEIRSAIRRVTKRLRDNNSALLRLRTSLAKILELK